MRLPSYFSEPRFLINKMGITAPLVLNEERRVALTAGLLHLISHSALTGGLGLRPPLFGDLCAFAPPAHPPPPHLQHPALTLLSHTHIFPSPLGSPNGPAGVISAVLKGH